MIETESLVSIGIPTFNRVDRLRASLQLVRDQDHQRLEIIIGDNASTDGTAEFVASIDDPRIRYVCAEVNGGPTPNFNRVREAATGEYFMWLGDDDSIDANFVSSCLRAFADDPALALAVGEVWYHDGDRSWKGRPVEPTRPDGFDRLADYYRDVEDNGAFYGLMPRRVIDGVAPMPNTMGNDLQFLAEVAYLGPFRIVAETSIHRAVGGASASLKWAAANAGMPWWQGEFPPLSIAWLAFRSIGFSSTVFDDEPRSRRVARATLVAAMVLRRFIPQAVPKYVRVLRERAGLLLGRRSEGRSRNR